jgi:hypothetical protein
MQVVHAADDCIGDTAATWSSPTHGMSPRERALEGFVQDGQQSHPHHVKPDCQQRKALHNISKQNPPKSLPPLLHSPASWPAAAIPPLLYLALIPQPHATPFSPPARASLSRQPGNMARHGRREGSCMSCVQTGLPPSSNIAARPVCEHMPAEGCIAGVGWRRLKGRAACHLTYMRPMPRTFSKLFSRSLSVCACRSEP